MSKKEGTYIHTTDSLCCTAELILYCKATISQFKKNNDRTIGQKAAFEIVLSIDKNLIPDKDATPHQW